jgi:hypothetical protein
MPSAYTTKSAAPVQAEPARKLATTMARNGAMVQVREATAYAAPKPGHRDEPAGQLGSPRTPADRRQGTPGQLPDAEQQ